MQVLVTSPIPSHPQNHGNRARVYSLCRILQQRGYRVHFVYGGFEGLSEEQELAMRACWDHVYIVPPKPGSRTQSRRNHHLIDDWYVPEVSDITNRILKIWDIKYCLANYVWFSRWLEDVPPGIPKYLDTHDMFANRQKSLRKAGINGNWYSTTPTEEAKAFDRADVVLAIQRSEAELFKKVTKQTVETLGHYLPENFLPDRKRINGQKFKVGYLASSNPINQHSLHHFSKALSARPDLQKNFSFHLAGAICDSSVGRDSPFEKLGFVESTTTFYQDMDIILNPNVGGTGLKIKSVEALGFGKPLVATADAMVGIETPEPLHQCADIWALAEALGKLADHPEEVERLGAAGRRIFTFYNSQQAAALDRLFPRADSPSLPEPVATNAMKAKNSAAEKHKA